ncbi:MAG: hypothetical protein JOZ62_02475 [Acidobacteriaceae bacterium]|nr:hypothetical protein [Acidobacteriaceae bacterium]
MRPAFHVFRKDARHLAIAILLFIVLLAAYDASVIRSLRTSTAMRTHATSTESPETLVLTILPLYAWFLIAMAIQDEALPGDTQFWITRPYRRSTLLLAKVLFVVVFVNLPLLLSDVAILCANGFWTWSEVPDLLLRQLVVSLWLVLPAFAIASVTRGLAQFATVSVLCCVGVFILANMASSIVHGGIAFDSSVWITEILCASVLLALAAVNAYATRRVLISRILVALAFFSFGAPELWASLRLALSPPTHEPVPVVRTGHRIPMSIDAAGAEGALIPDAEHMAFKVPVDVSNLPSGVTRVSVLGKVFLSGDRNENAEGYAILDSTYHLRINGLPTDVGHKFLQIRLNQPDYRRFAGKLVQLQLSADVDAFRDTPFARLPFERRSFEIPGIGRCDPSAASWFVCRTALRQPKPFVVYVARGATRLSDVYETPSVSVFPVFAGLNPVTTWPFPAGLSDSDQGLELVFLKPGHPIRLTASASAKIRVPSVPGGRW